MAICFWKILFSLFFSLTVENQALVPSGIEQHLLCHVTLLYCQVDPNPKPKAKKSLLPLPIVPLMWQPLAHLNQCYSSNSLPFMQVSSRVVLVKSSHMNGRLVDRHIGLATCLSCGSSSVAHSMHSILQIQPSGLFSFLSTAAFAKSLLLRAKLYKLTSFLCIKKHIKVQKSRHWDKRELLVFSAQDHDHHQGRLMKWKLLACIIRCSLYQTFFFFFFWSLVPGWSLRV